MTLAPRFRYSPGPAVLLDEAQVEVRDRVIERMHRGDYPAENVPCFCGAPVERDVLVAERDRYGLPVRTVMCSRCGLLRSSPRLTAEATARFYDEDYRDLYTGEAVGAAGLFEQQRANGAARARRLAGLVEGSDTIYEVGCGAGGLLEVFAGLGKRVAGADLGEEYLTYGRSRGLELVHGDAADLLAHTGEQADMVFLVHVLEHFLDLPTELGKLWRLLKPGGVLVVEVPGLWSVPSVYRGDLMLYLQNAHTYHFCGQTLDDVLSGCGFDVAYTDESALALAVRPETGDAPLRSPYDADIDDDGATARRVWSFLCELELQRLGAGRPAA